MTPWAVAKGMASLFSPLPKPEGPDPETMVVLHLLCELEDAAAALAKSRSDSDAEAVNSILEGIRAARARSAAGRPSI